MGNGTAHRGLIPLVLIALASGAPCAADFELRRWEYYREIAPPRAAGQYVRVTLDEPTYYRARSDMADLRIVRDRDHEVPYKMLEDRGGTEEKSYVASVLNRSDVAGKYNSFVLDLGKPGMISNRVQVQTPSVNFMRKVEIEGGNDGRHWATLRKDGYIFDFSRDYHSRSTAVSYPDSTFRYIRVTIWHFGEKPMQVQGAIVFRRKATPTREDPLREPTFTVSQNSDERSTDILLSANGRPLRGDRIVITSPDTNYHRQLEVSASENGRTWNTIGWGHILKYSTDKVKGEESAVSCSLKGSPYVRVRIRNHDDQPIRITGARIFVIRRGMIFRFHAGGRYGLYYGNPYAQPPVYDIGEILQRVPSHAATSVRLGPEQRNPDFVRPFATKPWLEKNPWVLWMVLLVAVALLGLLIVRSVVQTREAPPGGSG